MDAAKRVPVIEHFRSITPMEASCKVRILFQSLLFVSLSSCVPNPVDPVRPDIGAAMVAIDLGVVFSDSDYYVCLPFERIGLNETQEIETVQCSCNCANASIVGYHSPNGKLKGIRIDFEKEKTTFESPPMYLAIEVKLKLTEAKERTLVLKLMHTSSKNLVTARNY